MIEISVESDSRRKFNEKWGNKLLFIANSTRNPFFIVCKSTF